ncbi:BNR-4 repeat-containing protein [Pedobacter heparinus]|uniref:BNR-4 repeat-containing protein n=1 Tax=Pedobacter heparinus TaxID=984 RepID=UPI00292F09D0|nr:BNR-4 repeat-containing protein [Pedobacter heparinus]
MKRKKADKFKEEQFCVSSKMRVVCALLMFFSSLSIFAQQKSSTYEALAGDASWCWFSDPRAVYYKGRTESIYFSYITSKGDVMISARNQKTKVVADFVLHPQLQVDDHNVPSILFLPDGKMLVFYTEHNGRFFMRKSKNAEDISSWEEERVIPFGGNKITYSHPVMLKGEHNRIYMFWRGSDWRPTMAYSDDLGDTWSKAVGLIESKGLKNRPYLKVCSDHQNRIDFAFTDGHPGVETSNSVYHMYYEKGNFYQTNGESIKSISQLPIVHSDVKKVYDARATNIRSWISDVALDKNKRPVLVYTRYPEQTDHRYHYASWNGKHWQDEELTKAGGSMCIVPAGQKNTEPNYSAGISLDHQDPSNVYMALQVNHVFEVQHWKKTAMKWLINAITANSEENNYRPCAVVNTPAKKPVILWMSGQYQHYTKFNTKLRVYDRN